MISIGINISKSVTEADLSYVEHLCRRAKIAL